jgi:uncharacterized beta-barrel protein YwiB (DUF1934 family)
MTKEVLINISGLQMAVNDMENDDNEPIETLSAGNYYFKDGKHYVFFEEVAEGFSEITKAQIRIKGKESLEVIKKGIANMHMVFEKNKTNRCHYKTPFGQLHLGISTSEIALEETEDNINVKAEYALDVDYEPIADCSIRINVKPRGSKEFSIYDKMEF